MRVAFVVVVAWPSGRRQRRLLVVHRQQVVEDCKQGNRHLSGCETGRPLFTCSLGSIQICSPVGSAGQLARVSGR